MRTKTYVAALVGLATLLMLAALPAAAHLTGAVWTTAADGAKINANLYDQKCPPTEGDPCRVPPLVPFLNGGPSFSSPSRWVPNGDYYFQVTDPAGKVLLSTDSIECRRFRVEEIEVTPGVFRKVTTYPLASNPAPHITCEDKGYIEYVMTTIALCPFEDTPNNGGVYKLWITNVNDYNLSDPHAKFGFIPSCSKTDNFKVKKQASVWGKKVDDEGGPVEGVHIILYSVVKVKGQQTLVQIDETCTDGNGEFSFSNLSAGNYAVDEDLDLSNCVDCGCTDYSGWERVSPPGPIYFNITRGDLGRKGAAGQPIYVGEFVNNPPPGGIFAALSGRKFLDEDGHGCWDPEESTLADWQICLEMKDGNGTWIPALDGDGNPVPCQITDPIEGVYNFGNLPVPMTYRISETLKSGWLQTGPNTDPDEVTLYPPLSADPCGSISVDPPDADVTVTASSGRYVANLSDTAYPLVEVGGLNFGNKLAELCVEKRDACTNALLPGFEFTLYDCACETPVTEDGLETAINPIVTGGDDDCWTNLLAGDYCVKETAAPGWISVGPAQQCVSLDAGGTATVTFYNWAPCMGLTPGYWKNWRNHYTEAQFETLLEGTIAATIAEADLIFEHWDASPGDEMTILKAFLLADQLTLNLTQLPGMPNPSEGSLVPECSLDYYGTPIVLSEVIEAALCCVAPDGCSREDLLKIKNWLAAFAEARMSTCPCIP